MNKQEKLIAILLGLALAGWMWYSLSGRKNAAEAAQTTAVAQQTPATAPAASTQKAPEVVAATKPQETTAVEPPKKEKAPEKLETLANDEVELTLSTRGAVVKSAKLLQYAQNPGKISDQNPALVLDFSSAPALALEGMAGVAADEDFVVVEKGADFVVFRNATLTRRIVLKKNYQLEVEESFAKADPSAANGLSLGVISMGASAAADAARQHSASTAHRIRESVRLNMVFPPFLSLKQFVL